MLARKLIKIPGLCLDQWADRSPGVIVLMYHRVTGTLPFELDIPTPVFVRQMEHLSEHARVVSLGEATARLRQDAPLETDVFVLTFDDAYRDFYTTAFPVLQRLDLPATLYVPTSFVERGRPLPLSTVPPDGSDVAPCSWDMLRELQGSPLVTIGAHTHTHPELPDLGPDAITSELETSASLFQRHLGDEPEHFAYPRGQWNKRVEAQVAPRYDTCAVGTEGWRNRPDTFTPHRVVRLPVLRSDGDFFFRAKARGWMGPGERHLIEGAKRVTGK